MHPSNSMLAVAVHNLDDRDKRLLGALHSAGFSPEMLVFGASRNPVLRAITLPVLWARLIVAVIRKRSRWLMVHKKSHDLAPVLWLVNRFGHVNIIIDSYDPVYPTDVMNHSPMWKQRLNFHRERFHLRQARVLIALSPGFEELIRKTYDMDEHPFINIPVGADLEVFRPREARQSHPGEVWVAYWGNFHKHHGVDVILEAARLLRSDLKVRFFFMGEGLWQHYSQEQAVHRDLDNVSFLGKVSQEELLDTIAASDICLGIFSSEPLALCSITNKVFQGMAMGKPVITLSSKVTRKLLSDRTDIWLVTPESPGELAEAIANLAQDVELRQRLGEAALATMQEKYCERAVGETLKQGLEVVSVN